MSVISVLTEYNIRKGAVFRDKGFKFPDARPFLILQPEEMHTEPRHYTILPKPLSILKKVLYMLLSSFFILGV